MTLRPTTVLALVAALAAAGCGKLGELERPGPLLGGATGADAGPEPARTVRTVDPRSHDDRPLPPRTLPIDSQPSATSSTPQGALPDPYNNPR
ncbi:MAG: hypothetical protein ACK41C_08760 [Phenylobacterium sp.]|jgi:hypothetical protein|uniref:hypothetical protein n=1 Tax=Phenylobacterium sp. TaxID=1871053 RepID=UPI00391A5599